MAGITRATAAIFSTTGLTGTGGFGAAANGTTTTEAGSSNSLSNIQSGVSGAWAGGWLTAVLGASKFPAIEDMNAVNNVFSTQIAYILERGIPEYDAGTSYNTGDIARGIGLTTLYSSVGNGNIGNALSNATYWTFLCDLANLTANVFTGGTTTGSANAQVLASLVPATGFNLLNGQTIICTAGYTNTGSATLAITSPSVSATAIKKDSGSGLINLVSGDITVGDTLFLTYNTTGTCFVLTSGLALGTAAYKAASDNTKTNVASVSGSTTAGHVASFADTAGTVIDNSVGSSITNSLSGDVTLTTQNTFYDGPSVAQGTVGTWFASGTVTVIDSGGTATFSAKLWDGTTLIASGNTIASSNQNSISLSGALASPAGNIRISVTDNTRGGGVMKYDLSGLSKDCTLTAIRIA